MEPGGHTQTRVPLDAPDAKEQLLLVNQCGDVVRLSQLRHKITIFGTT